MIEKLELNYIQGNAIPGFNKGHQAFLFIHFPSSSAGRTWLKSLRHEGVWQVTSAEQVETFKQLRRLAQKRLDRREPRATWLNIAFTAGGLEVLLGSKPDGVFVGDFNIEEFARTPALRRVSSAPQPEVHAVLILAADSIEDLDSEAGRQEAKLCDCGPVVVANLRGGRLAGNREHFGYKDGISQPNVEGAPGFSPASPSVKPGEFILGYVDEAGSTWSLNQALTKNGSYLVFLKFQQHVGVFREAVRAWSSEASESAEQLGAEIIGRFPDGTEVADPFKLFAHIGRAHPQPNEVGAENPDRHRIIRRGIPFGPPLPPESPDDEHERGLLFLAYQADITRQFEHVWTHWLTARNFPITHAGEDPLTGTVSAGHTTREVLLPRADATGRTVRHRLPQFVTLDFGGYFFSPSIPALSLLCGESIPAQVGERKFFMPTTSSNSVIIPTDPNTGQLDFVKLVFDQNPYDIKPVGTLINGKAELDGPAQEFRSGNQYPDARSLTTYLRSSAYAAGTAPGGSDLEKFPYWTFNGESIRISKSMRLTYTWTGAPPEFTGYILIGFAGPVWP